METDATRTNTLIENVLRASNEHYEHCKGRFRVEVNYSPFSTLWHNSRVVLIGTNPGDNKNVKERYPDLYEKDYYPDEELKRYDYAWRKITRATSKYRHKEEWIDWNGRIVTPMRILFRDAFEENTDPIFEDSRKLSEGDQAFLDTLSLNVCFFATRNVDDKSMLRCMEECWPAVSYILEQNRPTVIIAYGNHESPHASAYSYLKTKFSVVSGDEPVYFYDKCGIKRSRLGNGIILYGLPHLSRYHIPRVKNERDKNHLYCELVEDLSSELE